jgi:hypothetical protein
MAAASRLMDENQRSADRILLLDTADDGAPPAAFPI